jgi:hypothetical protein
MSTQLKVSNVTASGYEANSTNYPQNVIDGDLSTRWSNPIPSWITLDLGSLFVVTEVDIAWFNGNERKDTFSISTSSDNSTWQQVFSGQSSGTTANFEPYKISNTNGARYVKVNVTANTQSSWASISEIKVSGSTPPPAPVPSPSPTPGIDQFGVKELYPSKLNGESWYMNADSLVAMTDKRIIYTMSASDLHKNTDGSIKVTKSLDSENRFNITTSTGYDHSKCSQDWATNLQRGYIQAPNDWRNVEITAYVRINSVYTVSGHSLVWYARGGHHSTSYPCEGSKYAGNIGYNLQTRFQKESGHPNYLEGAWRTLPTGETLAFGKWFGYKTAIYDTQGGVKVEVWLDVNLNNNWVKVLDWIDTGVSGTANPCGSTNEVFLWGGPQAVYRFDSTKDIDFNKMSIREITPPA